MKITRRGLPAVFCLLVMFMAVFAGTGCENRLPYTDASPYQKAVETARVEIWHAINTGKAGSASAAIMDNGKLVYAEGFGMADRAKSIPVDADTVFNMGSVSKTFCAAAVMILVDEGRVNLDEPVVNYVPDFTMADARYRDITVRMLLDHTSGIPGTTIANAFGYATNPGVYEDTLANLARSHLKHAPGAAAPYCNDGFTLAEILVTRVSGDKYIDFLSERIFKPLDLNNTGLSVGETAGLPAKFYKLRDGRGVPLEAVSILGAGGLSTTAVDLVKFADSFSGKGPQILSPESIAGMIEASPSQFAVKAMQKTGINPEMYYGLGLDFAGLPVYREQGVYMIGKGGDTPNYHSFLISDPENRISVAVLEAGAGGTATRIAINIFEAVLEAKGLMPVEEPEVSRPEEPRDIPESYAAMAGYYSPNFKISFDSEMQTCMLEVIATAGEASTTPLTYKGEYFVHPDGLNVRLISVDGQDLLVFGDIRVNMIMGQKLEELEHPLSLETDITGQAWLRRDSNPFELHGVFLYTVTPGAIEEMPGYIVFDGIHKIKSPVFAGMSSSLLRDLSEITLIEKDGQTWIQNSEMLFSPAEAAAELETGTNTAAIGVNAYNEWFIAAVEAVLSFHNPDNARVVVLCPDHSPIYDSMLDDGDVYIPGAGMIMVAGRPGDAITIHAR